MPPSSLIPYYWSPGWNSVQAMYKYVEEPNGSLKGGDPGVRLFDEKEEQEVSFFDTIPLPFESKADALWIVPVYQIFGSEELSSKGTAIAKRIQELFVWMNQKEAEKIDVHNNEIIQINILQDLLKVKVKIENSIPQGIGGLSFLLPGMPYLNLPAWGKLNKI